MALMDLETIDERPERTYNFSRPRPLDPVHYEPPPSVRAVNALHEPNRHGHTKSTSSASLPDEPRFFIDEFDSDRINTASSSDASASSELAWDGTRGELVAVPRPASGGLSTREQRHPGLHSRGNSTSSIPRASTSGSGSSSKTTTSSSSAPLVPRQPRGILKRSQTSEYSERPASEPEEDAASHHTVSEDGSLSSYVSAGKFQSSNFDISALSEKKLAKLRKKGVNPALYLEMKGARTRKGRVGNLTGNAFVG